MLAKAPAAITGGIDVEKMKPGAKLRTASITAARAGDVAADNAEALASVPWMTST